MKKLYTLFTAAALGLTMVSNAQFTVTYQVDVTEYIATVPLGAAGVRVGGNFAAQGAVGVIDWSPSDAGSAMTDLGSNIWSITIVYPDSSAGNTQQFKFVNNDWGTNEGSPGSLIATDGCGTDDGSGNINRTLVLPSSNVIYRFCWEKCAQCDGSSANITGIANVSSVSNFNVYPNPVSETATLTYSLTATSTVSMEVLNALGQRVSMTSFGKQNPGTFTDRVCVSDLSEGIYFVRLNVSGKTSTYRLSVVK